MKALRQITVTVFAVLLAFSVVTVLIILPLAVTGAINITRVDSKVMSPAINNGSLVISSRVNTDDVKKGDVVVLNSRPGLDKTGEATVSRVTSKSTGADRNTLFQVKGDNNVLPDSWSYSADKTTYKLLFAVPVVGFVFGAVASLNGAVTFGLLVIILAVVYLTVFHKRKPKAPKPEVEPDNGLDDVDEFVALLNSLPDASKRNRGGSVDGAFTVRRSKKYYDPAEHVQADDVKEEVKA